MTARRARTPSRLSALALLPSAPAHAAKCGGDFATFIAAISREAAAQGVSRQVIASALDGVTYDPAVMAFDRRQRGTFRKSFEEYARTRVTAARIKRARTLMERHSGLLARVERQFGVPRTLIMAIWTMETDNGGDMGKLPVVRTLATLAHDCRRTDLFQRRAAGGPANPPARSPAAERPGRRLCGRDRPDPVPAVVLHQVWRRFRRQRPRRPSPQRAGRARLHRQPAQGERLARRRPVRRGDGEFRGHARVEQGSEVYRRTLVYFAEQLR